MTEICYLNIKPGQEGDAAVFGSMFLNKLYTVVDLDNKVISVAHPVRPSPSGRDRGGDLVSIPKEGLKVVNVTSSWLDGVPPEKASGADALRGLVGGTWSTYLIIALAMVVSEHML